MTNTLSPRKPTYQPAIGPLGDVAHVFRRLGGLSRLDIVFSMLSVACVAFWSCLRNGQRKVARASIRPAVYLLTYIPCDKVQDPA